MYPLRAHPISELASFTSAARDRTAPPSSSPGRNGSASALPSQNSIAPSAPGVIGQVSPQGCADASLYRRVRQAGLTHVKMLPQLTAFDRADPTVLQWLEGVLLPKLNQDEAREWQAARAEAEAMGTFFMTWPHHCAVGTEA